MSRRLLNRTSRPAEASTALPDYEPLACFLDESARRALDALSNNRGTAPYEAHLKESVRHLGHSVGDLHERLRSRKERLHELQQRRQQKGTDKSPEEERLEAHVPGFEREVEELTLESERALRQVIDRRAELEDEASVVGDLFLNAVRRLPPPPRRRRGVAEVADDDEEEEEGNKEEEEPESRFSGLLVTMREKRAEKHAQYTSMSPHERYALHNDYKGFKKLWHDAAVGEEGPPLPDASKWFLPNGEPNMSTSTRGRKRTSTGENDDDDADAKMEEDDDDDDDDDIAIARETLSLKCPLTLLPMTEPYANRKCPHIFEKSAILDYLGTRDEHQCPQTGCSQKFSHAEFKNDFFLDEAMLRRIQRTKQAEQAHSDMDMDEDEETEQDASLILGAERGVRRGRVKTE